MKRIVTFKKCLARPIFYSYIWRFGQRMERIRGCCPRRSVSVTSLQLVTWFPTSWDVALRPCVCHEVGEVRDFSLTVSVDGHVVESAVVAASVLVISLAWWAIITWGLGMDDVGAVVEHTHSFGWVFSCRLYQSVIVRMQSQLALRSLSGAVNCAVLAPLGWGIWRCFSSQSSGDVSRIWVDLSLALDSGNLLRRHDLISIPLHLRLLPRTSNTQQPIYLTLLLTRQQLLEPTNLLPTNKY